MSQRKIQQRTERRISAALRLALVAILLLAQIALVVLLSQLLRQHMVIAYTALELVALGVALRIFSRPGGATYKTGWIMLVIFVPVVGLVLYLLWNGDRPNKQLTLKHLPMPSESAERQEESQANVDALYDRYPQWGRLAVYLHRQGFPLCGHTAVAYISSGEAYLRDVMVHMAQARRFILVESFIIAMGRTWDDMRQILRRKAEEGVEIKIIFDDFGSMMRISREEVEALRAAGIEVTVFNPVHQYVNRLYFNYRNHRKIIVIDGDTAYTGGANIGDEYANLTHRFGYWKDCGIRLEGQGAWGLTRSFIHMWENLGGEMAYMHDDYRPSTYPEGVGFCQSVSDGPDTNPVSTVEDIYLQLVTRANRTVYVTTPYLAVDEPMFKALCLAGDSGVDVRLMMPGTPDKKIAFLVAESYFGELLRHGVSIYRYTPGFLHSKMVVADGQVAFVGSVNMDYRSFHLHFECGTLVYGAPVIEELAEDLEKIMADSRPVSGEEWAARPWYRKLMGVFLRLFAMWI